MFIVYYNVMMTISYYVLCCGYDLMLSTIEARIHDFGFQGGAYGEEGAEKVERKKGADAVSD